MTADGGRTESIIISLMHQLSGICTKFIIGKSPKFELHYGGKLILKACKVKTQVGKLEGLGREVKGAVTSPTIGQFDSRECHTGKWRRVNHCMLGEAALSATAEQKLRPGTFLLFNFFSY